jgi:peptidoglycan/LPS O-acetylase OafA/YrhL
MNAMLFLAVSTLDKLKDVPPKFWWECVGGVIAFFLLIFVLKKLLQVNRVFLGIGVFAVCLVVFINWIYNRNEPAFLTPFVDEIAVFFPVKGDYERSNKPVVLPDEKPQPAPSHVY